MKLSDHPDARLVTYEPSGAIHDAPTGKVADADGVLFKDPGGGGMLLLWFHNRHDVPAAATPTTRWYASGNTIEDLSLDPSVHVPGGWHGWITNGEISNA